MQRGDGQSVTYDPKRLQVISAFQETSREFAQGDRVQFTGISHELGVSNRDLGIITKIEGTQLSVKMDGDKSRHITFDTAKMRHLDHGYAVTSHSSQGLTTGRVLVNMETTTHAEVINTRFAYVSISCASHESRFFTNDASHLGDRLATDVSKFSRKKRPSLIANRNSRTESRAISTGKRRAGSTLTLKASVTTRTVATSLPCSRSIRPLTPNTGQIRRTSLLKRSLRFARSRMRKASHYPRTHVAGGPKMTRRRLKSQFDQRIFSSEKPVRMTVNGNSTT